MPPIDRFLDLRIVGWHDVFVFSVLWGADSLGLNREDQVVRLETAIRPPETKSLLLGVGLKFEQTIGGPPSPTALQRFRNDHRKVHEVIDSGPAQMWDLASAVVRVIEKKTGKPVLLLFDGLEKMTDDQSQRLFDGEGRFLRELPCRAVVTAPLALSFEPYFGDILEHFSFPVPERLRALSCQPGEPGVEFFKSLAARRGAEGVASREIIDHAISWCGGLPRQFLQLLATAASQVLTGGSDQIQQESFAHARLRVTDRWQYQLEPADYDVLGKAERSTKEQSRLLRIGALIEYDKPDGTLRIGINPLVGPLLKRRETMAKQDVS